MSQSATGSTQRFAERVLGKRIGVSEDVRGELRVPGIEAADVPVVRRFVRECLSDIPDGAARDLELIASELVTNAWTHGTLADVRVSVAVTRDRATVTVVSASQTTPLVAEVTDWTVPEPAQLGGRGLGIVRRLADDIEIDHSGFRLAISAHRNFA